MTNFNNLTFELKVDGHTHLLEGTRKVVFLSALAVEAGCC